MKQGGWRVRHRENQFHPSVLCSYATNGIEYRRKKQKRSRITWSRSWRSVGLVLIPSHRSSICPQKTPVSLRTLGLLMRNFSPWWVAWGRWFWKVSRPGWKCTGGKVLSVIIVPVPTRAKISTEGIKFTHKTSPNLRVQDSRQCYQSLYWETVAAEI